MINISQVRQAGGSEHLIQKYSWQMVNLPMEVRNSFINWYLTYASHNPGDVELMRQLLELVPGRIRCASTLPKGSGPALVVASGSSLNEILPTVKNWKGAIICSSSQAATLIHYDRVPEYVTVLDPRDALLMSQWDEIAAPDWGDAKMLTLTSCPPNYMERWLKRARGNIYLSRIMDPTFDWYTHQLGWAYPWIRNIVLPMIDTGAGAIGYASWLGYKPIYLIGLDYGGPRFDGKEWHYDTKTWTTHEESKSTEDYSENSRMTLLYSARGALMSAVMQMRNHKYQQEIYQLSRRSNLQQFPKARWDDGKIVDQEPFDREAVCEEIECALSIWDTFIVPVNMGFGNDYHTFIVNDENAYWATLIKQNEDMMRNKKEFEAIEKKTGKRVSDLVMEGGAQIVAGEMLFHPTDEYGEWDWRKMEAIDIPAMITRRRNLIAKAKERGYRRGPAPNNPLLRQVKEMVDLHGKVSEIDGEGPQEPA